MVSNKLYRLLVIASSVFSQGLYDPNECSYLRASGEPSYSYISASAKAWGRIQRRNTADVCGTALPGKEIMDCLDYEYIVI